MVQRVKDGGMRWDLETDVLVIGSGAAGLPAAIKAVEGGSSVIVVEANYDVGGHAILSGGHMALGGGTSAQRKYGVEDSMRNRTAPLEHHRASSRDRTTRLYSPLSSPFRKAAQAGVAH